MVDFWLDTSIFIQAKNEAYGFDIAPGFWTALDTQTQLGRLCSSTLVYDELVTKNRPTDELARWAKDRKDSPLWVSPDKAVQEAYSEIARYVALTYPPPEAAKSFRGADLWIVAHAKAKTGRVVTRESLVNLSSTKAKIPNICAYYGIRPATTSDMLRSLGIVLDVAG